MRRVPMMMGVTMSMIVVRMRMIAFVVIFRHGSFLCRFE